MKQLLLMPVKTWILGCVSSVLALVAIAGCQPVFMTQDDYKEAHAPLQRRSEKADDAMTPSPTALTASPPTVNNPDRTPRYLTLQEAVAIALENGSVSNQAGAGAGQVTNTGLAFNGPGSLIPGQTERIRVLALNPAFAQAAMEQSVSRFDAFFYSVINWTNQDSLAGIPNLGNSFLNTSLFTSGGNAARSESGIGKPLPTGGYATVGMLVDYRQFSSNTFLNANGQNQGNVQGLFNPQYSARLAFGFDQPILKDAGIFVNEILSRFPGATGLGTDNTATSALGNRQGVLGQFVDRNTEGILISRLRFDQARAEFERNVQVLTLNTEVAYWNLYNKYGQLYSIEENLRIMHSVWQVSFNRFKLGASSIKAPDYYQIRAQYEEFRGDRLRALQEVLDAERNLRGILGLPVEDGERLIPITPPTLEQMPLEWGNWLKDALNLLPSLVLARENIKYHQYLLSLQYNNLRPDLRLVARYEPFGDGSTLTGNGTIADGTGTLQPTNAFRQLASGKLADWQIGLNLTMPLGFRAEFAAIRGARLELTQAHLLLSDQEDKASRFLAEQFQELVHWYQRIEAHRSERIQYGKGLTVRYQIIEAGGSNIGGGKEESPLAFLDNQRRYAAALVKEYDAIAQYNATLARLEYAKGTILQTNNIHISEGALPQCAQVRAVEYEKQRTKALVLRDRPDSLEQSLEQPGRRCATKEEVPTLETTTPDLLKTHPVDVPLFVETKKTEVPSAPIGQNSAFTTKPVEKVEFHAVPPTKMPVVTPPAPYVAPLPALPTLPQVSIPESTLSQPKSGPGKMSDAAGTVRDRGGVPVQATLPQGAPLVTMPTVFTPAALPPVSEIPVPTHK